ncbi:helix-turn-helix domain protein [Catenulispora acidiphila DSM 44928]|uniref:Helix-turn-helix domain protein n=1 Tax=Catenulispora acidiphila (strain DSM 44928 / JCM 14897 / NBRC 102108 / NRRL B-24433 / ID139908) TaxID=479433 RepID=C7QB59_CATAD|nr:helix-turn-helix transcriptional regulator [Catenulispora acidiphila]ACU76350.1 helix-turn-helix domain protein [Catenulispora acidiphila DSM 44928]
MTTPVPVDPESVRRANLREFLVARRARITPEEVGLAPGSRRRTPGLRREEVAVLAGVGTSWYQWLEQGRDITVSSQVLDAVGRVLKLDEPETRHLYALAGLNPPPVGRLSPADAAGPVDQALVHLVDTWLPNPGMIIDRYWNIVVANRAAELALHTTKTGWNCLHQYFLDEIYRESLENWTELAPRVVATYRSEMTASPGDEGFRLVVENLLTQSTEFAELWARQGVAHSGVNLKSMSSRVGPLHFESVTLAVPDRADLRIVLHNPQAGSDTRAKMERLLAEDERRNGLRLVAG